MASSSTYAPPAVDVDRPRAGDARVVHQDDDWSESVGGLLAHSGDLPAD